MEVAQPLHTWFSRQKKNPASSKLDRVLTPDDEAFLLVFNPVTRVLTPPKGSFGANLSDHLPVTLIHRDAEAEGSSNYLADSLFGAEFRKEFERCFDSLRHYGSPFGHLQAIKALMRRVAHKLRK